MNATLKFAIQGLLGTHGLPRIHSQPLVIRSAGAHLPYLEQAIQYHKFRRGGR